LTSDWKKHRKKYQSEKRSRRNCIIKLPS
jgi:hypothetical protein